MIKKENGYLSYIQAIEMTEVLFPPKSKKDYHSIECEDLIQEFLKNITKYKLKFDDITLEFLLNDIEDLYLNAIGYNEILRLKTDLKPRSIKAQLFLSRVKICLIGKLMNQSYEILQQYGGPNNFSNLGDIDELRTYITRKNIYNYVKEVISSGATISRVGDLGDRTIAKDILLHFGLSPITYRKNPGFVADIVNIIHYRTRELEKNSWPEKYSADEIAILFDETIHKITDYIWSFCQFYLEPLIEEKNEHKLTRIPQ